MISLNYINLNYIFAYNIQSLVTSFIFSVKRTPEMMLEITVTRRLFWEIKKSLTHEWVVLPKTIFKGIINNIRGNAGERRTRKPGQFNLKQRFDNN